MKKRIAALLTIAALSIASVMTAYAGTWKWDQGGWSYELDAGYCAANEWQYINGDWYYFNEYAYMVTDWQYLAGDWYYFDKETGAMAHDCWMDGGWIDSEGVWRQHMSDPGDGGYNYQNSQEDYYEPNNSGWSGDPGDRDTGSYYWYDSDGDVWYWNGYEHNFIGSGNMYYIDGNGYLREYYN